MMKNKSFAIFILTHNRADKVYTYKMLKRSNYSGKVYFIIDDTDPQIEKYIKNFGKENVIIFNKKEIAKTFDVMDNFDDYRSVIYARNASWGIAEKLGLEFFMMLDDDYSGFYYRFDRNLKFITKKVYLIDEMIDNIIEYYKKSPMKSIAFAQAGDYIGGDNGFWSSPTRIRKVMNTFILSPKRKFDWLGRLNDDVNTYIHHSRLGNVFLTIPFIAVVQKATQASSGGLTEIYLNYGTYTKSFYTVMIQPSSVSIAPMGEVNKRIHHRVNGICTYPMIINEKYKLK